MSLEKEIKTSKFESQMQKSFLNVLFTASWLRARINQHLKPFGLTQEQYNVLRILRGSSPHAMCMMDIASRMLDRSSNVTRIMEKLLQKQYVERVKSELDKREVKMKINENGLDLLAQIDASFKETNPHFTALSEVESQLLNALLDKMREVEIFANEK